MSSDFEIAPRFSTTDWRSLSLECDNPNKNDWKTAIQAFECRLTDRLIEPADKLEKLGQGVGQERSKYGFAILALDFILIEAIQGFREGKMEHIGVSKELVVNFLVSWKLFKDCLPNDADATTFAKSAFADCRCAIHHQGATASGLRVKASGKAFVWQDNKLIEIGRRGFHAGVKDELACYLKQLRKLDNTQLLRQFKLKMDFLAGITPPAA